MERDYFTCTHQIVLSTLWNQGQVLTNYQVSVQWWVLKIISTKQTCLQWTCTSFSPPKPLPLLPSPPLSWVLACTLIVTWKWQRLMHEPGTCMTLDSQSFLRLYWWANWRAKGAVLIITFFCMIYRYFWLSLLVPSFFMYSCTHILLLSTVQQQQANLMLLLQREKKVMSNSLGLVDFAIGLVNSVFNLLDEQVMFYKEFEWQKNFEIISAGQKVFGASWNDFWASKC